jgi:hypothetical protein
MRHTRFQLAIASAQPADRGAVAVANPTLAAWELDGKRSIAAVPVGEECQHRRIASFQGAQRRRLTRAWRGRIDLDSVETLVPIRNQRMRELFFETVRFPAATLSAMVPESLLGCTSVSRWKQRLI